jgi:hypothetical protein
MVFWLLVGTAALVVVIWGARVFVQLSPGDLARAVRTFVAVFGTMAGMGLLLMGRFGLALILVAATVMAFRALLRDQRPPDPLEGGGAGDGPASAVTTDLLEMRLDHASGELDGMVRRGPLAGSRLSGLDIGALRALLAEAAAEDPPSLPLLEAYLDRRFPDWRSSGTTAQRPASGPMDEATALGILGLEAGADEAAIRAAHRRLMARLHPDHGGSDWLAARINEARDFLLKRR